MENNKEDLRILDVDKVESKNNKKEIALANLTGKRKLYIIDLEKEGYSPVKNTITLILTVPNFDQDESKPKIMTVDVPFIRSSELPEDQLDFETSMMCGKKFRDDLMANHGLKTTNEAALSCLAAISSGTIGENASAKDHQNYIYSIWLLLAMKNEEAPNTGLVQEINNYVFFTPVYKKVN